MSNAGDMPELEPLEEVAAAPSVDAQGATPVSLPGMPAPVFGMRAPKEYYRFFFAGLLIVLGCLMPWGPQMDLVGWKTVSGGVCMIIGLMICWTSWVAIAHSRFGLNNMTWLILAVIPLIGQILNLVNAFELPAVKAYITSALQGPNAEYVIDSWGDLFKNLRGYIKKDVRGDEIANFFRNYGSGKFFVLVGSVLAEVLFLMSLVTGAKRGAQQKAQKEAARSAAKSSRKGRR